MVSRLAQSIRVPCSIVPIISRYPTHVSKCRTFYLESTKSNKFSFIDLDQLSNPSINLTNSHVNSIQPTSPARTRFAPSPTGKLHLGSLRTALYNYLLAKSTGGDFLLRIEDTDQTRKVAGAEEEIYDILKWCGINPDESEKNPGSSGPYKQSERLHIYQKYADILIEKGFAYKCYCSKERLGDLRESAMKLKPPTTVTYDRHCFHGSSDNNKDIHPVIRFKSPDKYEPFEDLLHGRTEIQPQINFSDRRYDDFVILKSDGFPTYHFANIIDDHLMNITHVIRGEEWLSSTPKHVALYKAFGWSIPKFIHIPLLTSLGDKKLSKRSGDIGISQIRDKGIIPEAVVNFVALFGWSPPKEGNHISFSEVLTLKELEKLFTLDNLTKGNAKVDMNKLSYFNQQHIPKVMKDLKRREEIAEFLYPNLKEKYPTLNRDTFSDILAKLSGTIHSLDEVEAQAFVYVEPTYTKLPKKPELVKEILEYIDTLESVVDVQVKLDMAVKQFPELKKKSIFQAIRFAYTGGGSGVTIPIVYELIGAEEANRRLKLAIKVLDSNGQK